MPTGLGNTMTDLATKFEAAPVTDFNPTSESQKPVHTLVLDAAPLLRNSPPISTLLAQAHTLSTTPSIFSEIRDTDARSRVETLYLPFLEVRTPRPESLKFVGEFARKTGDKAVLSAVDLEIIALAYELECERNGGDWRLRRVPGQKGLNGKPPVKEQKESSEAVSSDTRDEGKDERDTDANIKPAAEEEEMLDDVANQLQKAEIDQGLTDVDSNSQQQSDQPEESQQMPEVAGGSKEESYSGSDSEGWITPSNIKKHHAKQNAASAPTPSEPKQLQVATITGDFAMQNVLLQMNLNLLSPTHLQRIRHLKTYVLRCHGCFFTTKEMTKQFCPRCGKPTLTRVSCTTDANGEFKLHLKKNMQWSTRGNIYSIPKPVSGSASGKWKGGGGQAGWGNDLILAPDQKEYVRAIAESERQDRKERNLMDVDYLPGILTGERKAGGGRMKIGAGRNINSRKKR